MKFWQESKKSMNFLTNLLILYAFYYIINIYKKYNEGSF